MTKHEHEVEAASTTEGLPVSLSLGAVLADANVLQRNTLVDQRVVFICALCIVLGICAAAVARILFHLIGFFTNISFFGRFSSQFSSPADNHLGLWVIAIPVIGGLIVGVMARYGSRAIRGHGIPEAMEQVLTNDSRIPARLTWLKPLSAAVAIGTGGPFGAEGPIIATGGALGSFFGQILSVTANERKTLLAAGAAAGMAATFGSPVAAVLLAIELLLFEFRPRSLIPVALASAAATATRMAILGFHPIFPMPNLMTPSGSAQVIYVVLGAIMGVVAIFVTRAVYLVEDLFDLLPVHWMWWPAIGGLAVGIVGYFAPLTLGVGYTNITGLLTGAHTMKIVATLCVMKFISWAIALGSGTSGGTLAPLFTIGGALGALLGAGAQTLFPHAGVDIRIAALVGMAAIFAGAARALLTSVVFAFETTLQPLGLLPLLGGCTASFLISCLMMKHTIMTEKIARRGIRVPAEYEADFLNQITVATVALTDVMVLLGTETLGATRTWIKSGVKGTSHQGFPIVDKNQNLVGVLTRRDLLDSEIHDSFILEDLLKRPPVTVYDDCTLREAADYMVNQDVGRLPVMSRKHPAKLVGIITRRDLLAAHRRRLDQSKRSEPTITIPFVKGDRVKT